MGLVMNSACAACVALPLVNAPPDGTKVFGAAKDINVLRFYSVVYIASLVIRPFDPAEGLPTGPFPLQPEWLPLAETLYLDSTLHTMQTAPSAHARPSASHHRSHSTEPRRKPVAPAPWQAPITHTHAWALNQGFSSSTSTLGPKQPRYLKEGWTTEEWVVQPPMYYVSRDSDVPIVPKFPPHDERGRPHRSGSLRRDGPTTPRRAAEWDDMMYQYEADAERWMRHEEQARRLAEERLRTRNRLDDELRRIDERIRLRKHEQRRMYEESRARAMAELREHEHKYRTRLEKGVAESWEKYESRWSELGSSSEALNFANIPWPTVSAPRTVEDLSASAISAFLLSGAHSPETSRKERIRSAQLRWHPDRFRRLMSRVAEDDRAAVEEGVGAVARVLNDLMQREKGNSR